MPRVPFLWLYRRDRQRSLPHWYFDLFFFQFPQWTLETSEAFVLTAYFLLLSLWFTTYTVSTCRINKASTPTSLYLHLLCSKIYLRAYQSIQFFLCLMATREFLSFGPHCRLHDAWRVQEGFWYRWGMIWGMIFHFSKGIFCQELGRMSLLQSCLSEPGSTKSGCLAAAEPLLAPRAFRISHQGVSCPELQGKSK